MRKAAKPLPIISDHRLGRFLTVVWLRLMRMAGKLLLGEAPYREELNAISRFVAAFLIIRAARAIGAKHTRGAARPANAAPGFVRRKLPTPFACNRAIAGSKLRRQLRGRSAFAHVSALIRAILNLDALTAQLVKRLKRRLTRLRPLVLVHAYAEACAGAAALGPCADDSS